MTKKKNTRFLREMDSFKDDLKLSGITSEMIGVLVDGYRPNKTRVFDRLDLDEDDQMIEDLKGEVGSVNEIAKRYNKTNGDMNLIMEKHGL